VNNQEFKIKLLKKSYALSLEIIKIASRLKNKDRLWFGIADQLIRSGTSIGANITEAQGAVSRRDFKNFIQHAYKSSWETQYWLGLIRDAKLISSSGLQPVIDQTKELAKILNSVLLSLKGKK